MINYKTVVGRSISGGYIARLTDSLDVSSPGLERTAEERETKRVGPFNERHQIQRSGIHRRWRFFGMIHPDSPYPLVMSK